MPDFAHLTPKFSTGDERYGNDHSPREQKRADQVHGSDSAAPQGVIVYQESQSFDRKPVARAWMMRREAELALPGALEKASRKDVPLKKIIERYLEVYELIRPLGTTKRVTLKRSVEPG